MDKNIILCINTKINKIKRLKHITVTFDQLKYYLENKIWAKGMPANISSIVNDINNVDDDELISYLIKSNEQIKKEIAQTKESLQENDNEEQED